MRIVTDGKLYAIEKGWIFKKYLSINDTGNWFSQPVSDFYCWSNKNEILHLFNKLKKPKEKRIIRKVREDELY